MEMTVLPTVLHQMYGLEVVWWLLLRVCHHAIGEIAVADDLVGTALDTFLGTRPQHNRHGKTGQHPYLVPPCLGAQQRCQDGKVDGTHSFRPRMLRAGAGRVHSEPAVEPDQERHWVYACISSKRQ